MLGHIGFEKLHVRCIVGTEPHERKSEQDLYIDVNAELDVSAAAQSDSLKDTVNYVMMAEICQRTASEGKYYLLEKLATEVLHHIMSMPAVRSVSIRIRKPSALPNAECAFVELAREHFPSEKTEIT